MWCEPVSRTQAGKEMHGTATYMPPLALVTEGEVLIDMAGNVLQAGSSYLGQLGLCTHLRLLGCHECVAG
jgi:hypothetical protein